MSSTPDDQKNTGQETRDELRQRLHRLEQRVASLTRKKHQFEAVFNHPRSFVGILDLDGRLLEANQRSLDFIDASLADVEGQLFWMTPWWSHSSALQDKLRENIKLAARGEHVRFEAEHYSPGGDRMVVDFYLQPVHDDDGTVISLLAVGRDITSLKETQEHLRTTRRRLEDALETGRLAWWEMDVESGTVAFDEQKARMLGYDPVDFAGASYTTWTDLLHPDDRPAAMQAMRDHLSGATDVYEVEYRVRTAAGTYRWFQDRGAVTKRDGEGNPLLVTGIVIDITDRMQAEQQLERSRWQLSLLNRVATIFLTESEADMYADVLDVVREALDSRFGFFGYINEDGDLVGQIAVGDTPDGYGEDDVQVLERIAGYVAPLLRAKLEEKRQRQALQRSEEKYRTLTENVNLGVYRTTPGPDGTFVEVNPAMVDMFGYDSREELMEQLVSALYRHPEERRAFNEKMHAEGEVRDWELELRKKDGTRFTGSVSAVAVTDATGEVQYFDGIVADITERKHMQDALSQLNDVLKLTNKIMRHDMVNHLNIIRGALELYSEEPEEELLGKAFSRIEQSVELIKRMRELEALVASGDALQPHDLKETIEDVAGQYDIPISITGDATVLADAALHPVIDNIVRNAVVHGGTDRIDVSISAMDGQCEVRIADTGSGIPDHVKERVFEERFSHGGQAGTGLGLYIVKKTVERYGGSVAIEDNEPHGTVVVLHLKRAREQQ
jgi:PAS domain S-box-containing protein